MLEGVLYDDEGVELYFPAELLGVLFPFIVLAICYG